MPIATAITSTADYGQQSFFFKAMELSASLEDMKPQTTIFRLWFFNLRKQVFQYVPLKYLLLLNVFTDNGGHNISEVAERVKIAQSTASEHLALLKRASILVAKKVEKEVYYKLSKKGIIAVIDELKTILSCCPDE
jgi:DNA-binding transcriptional ArsR family regulator